MRAAQLVAAPDCSPLQSTGLLTFVFWRKELPFWLTLKTFLDGDTASMTMEMDVTHSSHQVNKRADDQTGLTGAEVTVSRQVQFLSGRPEATFFKITG